MMYDFSFSKGKMPCQSLSEDESLSLLLSRTRTPNSLNEYIKKCPRCGTFQYIDL